MSAALNVIPHLQEQLFHVVSPQLRPAWQMLLQQPNLFRCNFVLHELALGPEERLHVSDEGFGRQRQKAQTMKERPAALAGLFLSSGLPDPHVLALASFAGRLNTQFDSWRDLRGA